MGFGQTLREAREARGYTIEQLAEATHIMARTIKGLEDEDFSSIVAPIYGRGFVKICCQTLGLDPKPMIDEFMAIYSGEKPAAAKPLETPKPAPEPKPDEPSPVIPPAAEAPPTKPPIGDLFNQQPEPERPSTSRYAPLRPQDDYNDGRRTFSIPVIPWRLVILIVGAIVVIWALVSGCLAIFRSLGGEGEPESLPVLEKDIKSSDSGGKDSAAPITAAPKTQRAPKSIKPLYID